MAKKTNIVRAYYVFPCCLLLLNLCNNLISYKTEMIHDPFVRVIVLIVLVLFGSSIVAFAVAPGLEATVRFLHHGSRNEAGLLGEIAFLLLLGAGVYWLYYQFYVHGAEALLPEDLWNSRTK